MRSLVLSILVIALAGCADDAAPPPRAPIPPVGTYTQTPDPAPRPLPGPDPYIESRLPMDGPLPPALPGPSPLLPPPPATMPNP